MPRLSLKPDASFFRKIAIGAFGARAVAEDLSRQGHRIVELERGSTDTKLWKEVKRKRVRIPDLVCLKCGLRIESRAKTKPDLSMSHSRVDEARGWDFGMVDSDVVAFPTCEVNAESYWSRGHLDSLQSYWHERNWVTWRTKGAINYFRVASFRSTEPVWTRTKGVTEGSETSISWKATFSTRAGKVDAIGPGTIRIRRELDGHRYTWRVDQGQAIRVSAKDDVEVNQVIASSVQVMAQNELRCTEKISKKSIRDLLMSRERTQRFTGVKLARLLQKCEHFESISELTCDEEEDVYIRLEGASYLASVCNQDVETLFWPYLIGLDQQNQLEAVITLGETNTQDSIRLLSMILNRKEYPYFLRIAAAWSLARSKTRKSIDCLIGAFGDVEQGIREEALQGLSALGKSAIPSLLSGLDATDMDRAAGCAEVLRQLQPLGPEVLDQLTQSLDSKSSIWTIWLLGNLPREEVASSIAHLQNSAPHLQYAMSVLWAFAESWVARNWELGSRANSTADRRI